MGPIGLHWVTRAGTVQWLVTCPHAVMEARGVQDPPFQRGPDTQDDGPSCELPPLQTPLHSVHETSLHQLQDAEDPAYWLHRGFLLPWKHPKSIGEQQWAFAEMPLPLPAPRTEVTP